MSREHGYLRYAEGCRCEICRAGKTAYIRQWRASSRAARLAAKAEGRRYVAEGIRHGMNGYQNYACRCLVCRVANANYQAEYRRRKAEKGGS